MRELLFKNLTSKDKSRRILYAKEITNEEGITTRIQKHLIYAIKETALDSQDKKIKPEIFILKEKNTKEKRESFFIKMKGGIYANCNNKLFAVSFLHSLKIESSTQRANLQTPS